MTQNDVSPTPTLSEIEVVRQFIKTNAPDVQSYDYASRLLDSLIQKIEEVEGENEVLIKEAHVCEAEHWDKTNVTMFRSQVEALTKEVARLRSSSGVEPVLGGIDVRPRT